MIPYNTLEELQSLVGKVIKHKHRSYIFVIVEAVAQDGSMWVQLGSENSSVYLDELAEYYEFLDGSPIGKHE